MNSLSIFTLMVSTKLAMSDNVHNLKESVHSIAPYQVSFHYEGKHVCDGALISEFYVLSAAFCK